ncbi:unnamed protein product, partial [Laminaria digitata]
KITTQAVASTGATFVSEEPSLWRDYEGRENARDRGVLTRTNRSLRLDLDSPAVRGAAGELVYALDVEVQVPVEFLGQAVALEALVSPVVRGEREGGPGPASRNGQAAPNNNNSNGNGNGNGGTGGQGAAGGGRRRGVGGDYASRLDNLFALSRIAPVRLPVKRCFVPMSVVQPIAITSRSCPSSCPLPSPSSAVSFAGGIGRCLVSIEARNAHPTARVTIHDVEAHVDATARCGERASSLGFSAPGKAGRGGGGRGGGGSRRRMAGGAPRGGSPPGGVGGLEGSIEQPPLTGSADAASFSRVFCASWVAKPPLPLELAPGEVQGFVLAISSIMEPLPPRRAGGRFESPVTFVWTLDGGGGGGGGGNGGNSSGSRSGTSLSPPPSSPRALSAAARSMLLSMSQRSTTSIHLAQWQSEQRARDEVLVRVKGQPRVRLNRVFEV